MAEKNQMYFWLMISDIVATILLETLSQSGMSEGEVTKEMWMEMSAVNAGRRKAAIDKIKAH